MLKRLLARHVPRAIWDHPTRGFVLPLDRWIAGPLRDRVRKVVCEEGPAFAGPPRAAGAARRGRGFGARAPAGLRVEAKRAVWALFVLDEWCRRHL